MVSEQTRQAAGDVPELKWGERELHWLRNVPEPVATYLAFANGQLTHVQEPQRKRSLLPSWGCRGGAADAEAAA
jgi:hypothetical protein